MYAKIETERLNYLRSNQKQLRAENYIHLKDAFQKQDADLNQIGQMVILPSSFTGGSRYMHEKTQDAMTYVRHYGRPHLFITFTCNPNWTDIKDKLKSGQKSHDRQDVITRVFKLKLNKLMNLIVKGQLFGEVRCRMCSIEWQKRGLPHAHILVWLVTPISPNDIDKIIRAEIPNPIEDQLLFNIVKSNMIHGPCGSLNPYTPCMKDGFCIKRYPRPLICETQTGNDGYPLYRRRSPDDDGHTVEINGKILDNQWVVPYNAVLSRTFNAHINVEFCNSVKSIKYVCKYLNKGSDQAAFKLKNVNKIDEIEQYETGRYICSSEAVWRILSFSIHERYPAVVHLAVHLENGQRVHFTTDNILEKITNPPCTTLLAFFELCQRDEFAKTLIYHEVPSYYVWNNKNFIRRKRGQDVEGWPEVKKDSALGRVYTIHPNNTECYHLRMLLHVVRGPTSFEHLKSVNGVILPTFQAACRELGLLESDEHYDLTLEEAALCHSPLRLRELFSVMLIFCQLSDPCKLWEKYKIEFSEDITRQIEREHNEQAENLRDEIYNKCLLLIEDAVLSLGGQNLKHYGLPQPNRSNVDLENREYMREINYDTEVLEEVVSCNETNLTDEQLAVYKQVLNSVESGQGKFFFLDAPAGTGKTFLINLLLTKIRVKKELH